MSRGMLKQLLLLLIILLNSACYAGIRGIVVDAETSQPIEGAVMLVEWTITKGLPGLAYTESYKVVEMVSDKEGVVNLEEGVLNPLVNPPHVTVYKKGYVAWNNEFIFPDYRERKDFTWRDGYKLKLEIFKHEYSYDAHIKFINGAIRSGIAIDKKDLIKEAFEWEKYIASRERIKKGLE
jgi:hypothetical protein